MFREPSLKILLKQSFKKTFGFKSDGDILKYLTQ